MGVDEISLSTYQLSHPKFYNSLVKLYNRHNIFVRIFIVYKSKPHIMKKCITKIFLIALLAISGLVISCKDKAEKADSYGPNENSEIETPTKNDDATKDSVIRETGPGSATVGDTANRTPPANK